MGTRSFDRSSGSFGNKNDLEVFKHQQQQYITKIKNKEAAVIKMRKTIQVLFDHQLKCQFDKKLSISDYCFANLRFFTTLLIQEHAVSCITMKRHLLALTSQRNFHSLKKLAIEPVQSSERKKTPRIKCFRKRKKKIINPFYQAFENEGISSDDDSTYSDLENFIVCKPGRDYYRFYIDLNTDKAARVLAAE